MRIRQQKTRNMWTLFIVALSTAFVCCSAEIGSYDYDNKIEETGSNGDRDNLTSNVYVLPEQIFNDGKPFYVKKDASGTIDFNAKTTPESLPTPTDVASTQSTAVDTRRGGVNSTRKHDISVDNTVRAQNIHDYLNLPVKYQSSKFVYPLVSSSYANLKYQGNNKNYISNHKSDSSTVKSVPYTTKKYKTTYPTKSYTTAFASKASTTESYDSSTTKTTPMPSTTRKYSSISPRSPTPSRRFTPNRVSTTTQRSEYKFQRGRSTTTTSTTTTSTTTQTPIDLSDNGAVTSVVVSVSSESSISSTTISPNKGKNVTESEKEPDSMNIGDLFSYFWNNNNGNDESEETEATRPATKATPSTTVMTLRPAISSTRAPVTTKENENIKTHNSRYNMTMDSATRRPFNRTTSSEFRSSTIRPTTAVVGEKVAFASTASPVIAQYGDKASVAHAGKFRPPTNMENIRVSPGAQTASFVTNGQVSAAGYGNAHPSYIEPNTFKGQFQPPAQNNMKNIVVLPESNSASFVATSQLQTTTRLDQKPAPPPNENVRRPVANLNTIDETTKPGIQFFSKGQVTSAEAYDNPNQNKVVFHGPSANSNNIVIAPGTHTAAFVTSSQLSMGNGHQPAAQDQKIKNVENEINAYGPGMQASQRPHGFQLPSTTAIPRTVVAEQTANNETQAHIRFPTENGEHAGQLGLVHQPETAPLIATNNTIKFPANQVPQQTVQQVPQAIPAAPVQEGLVKFQDIRNEINDGIDATNYKQQIIQTPSVGGNNFVVFRPQPAMTMPQAPLVMGLTVPQIYRNPAFVFKKPSFVHYPRKNYTLPNILPQFRPTQPQPQISMSPEMVNQLRQGQLNRPQYLYNAQNLRYKAPMQILYSQRPMQIRPPLDQTQNRRHFELHPGNLNRIYDHRQMPPQVYNNRQAIGSNALLIEPQRFEENMKVAATNGADSSNMDSSKNPDFENGDDGLAVQPIVESQKEIPKVEPVTTLQMIHSKQRLLQKTGAHAMNGLSANRNATIAATVADPNGMTEKPLYVVYPMQKSSMASANTVNGVNRGTGEIATILAEQTQHKPATAQQLGLPYTLDKQKSRYILNSRPAYEFEKKSDQQQDPIAAIPTDNDEEDR